MFRQEKAKLPFNEIAHLTGESFGFSINLRTDETPKRKQERVAAPAAAPMRTTTADGKRIKDQFAVKETNCMNSQCVNNNDIYAAEFQERLDLLFRLEELLQVLEQQEQALVEGNNLYQTMLTTHHDNSLKVTELGTKEMECKARRNEVNKEQVKLQQEVRRMEKAKVSVVEGFQQQQQQAAAAVRNSEVVIAQSNKHQDRQHRKHNGVYVITVEGLHAWTCCNSHEADGEGCADDQSVGVRSTLPLVKNYFSNQLAINHPLQHGSSLFLDNSVRRSLQVGSTAFRNDSAAEGIHEPSHNHTDSLYLGRGSSLDYFSVHKPVTRVLAMQPHMNKSIRSVSDLSFGAPKATSKYVADLPSQSVYSRPATAGATLQRASLQEVYPHLDKKVVHHNVEQKYVRTDYSKPPPGCVPGSGVDGTKVYALYTLPYAHKNTSASGHSNNGGHGLFTQSMRGPSYLSSTASTRARPHTAGASAGGIGAHNASVLSAVSWGMPVHASELPGPVAGHHSEHPSRDDADDSKASRTGSRDSDESCCGFEPRFDSAVSVTSATVPGKPAAVTFAATATSTMSGAAELSARPVSAQNHFMLPKSLPSGHKALIGKQRAVPERTKLTRNRPLASADAYKIYNT